MQVLPVSADMIRQATQRDPILSRVMGYTEQGWPAVNEKELEPFYKKKDELTIQDECLIRGARILIPPKCQPQVLDELYDDHLGVAKTKALARSYVWWPGIDKAIEQESKRCTGYPFPKLHSSTHGSGQHAPGSASTLILRDHSWGQCY